MGQVKFEVNPKNKRAWTIWKTEEKGINPERLAQLDLNPSSITNNFKIVTDLFKEFLRLEKTNEPLNGLSFHDWFIDLIKKYDASSNFQDILDNAENILEYSKWYINAKNIDFNQFSKLEKKSKTSIMFLPEDIKAIVISSTALKIYSIFSYDKSLKVTENVHKQIYEKLVEPCVELETTTKIFQLIRSRMYRSSITDRYMWDMIKIVISETPDSYIMTVFNFIMINMISCLSAEKNPIPYLVSLIDDSVRWMMRTVYKDRIVYGEAFSGSDDIYGSSVSKESFYVYSCNDVIGKAAKIGMDLLETEYELVESQFNEVRDRIDEVDAINPTMKLLTFPIISNVLEIPYRYLLTCPPKHGLMMGIFMYFLSQNIIDKTYPIITEFLISCPKLLDDKGKNKNRFDSTKSSYNIRDIEFIINNNTKIFGFSSNVLKYNIMSSICGVLSASKKDLVHTITGRPLKKTNYLDLEHDVINFFISFYSNELDPIFNQMRNKADDYF